MNCCPICFIFQISRDHVVTARVFYTCIYAIPNKPQINSVEVISQQNKSTCRWLSESSLNMTFEDLIFDEICEMPVWKVYSNDLWLQFNCDCDVSVNSIIYPSFFESRFHDNVTSGHFFLELSANELVCFALTSCYDTWSHKTSKQCGVSQRFRTVRRSVSECQECGVVFVIFFFKWTP